MSIVIKSDRITRAWKYYDIMHKNRRVARIYKSGKCTINYPSFMPYNLYLEKSDDIDSKVNNLNNFYYWCSSRVLTLDRKYAKEILCSIGAGQSVTDKDRAAISISYHGLCLTDVYWIRAEDEKVSFEEMSLFRHSLSDAFTDVSLRGSSITLQNAELVQTKQAAGDVGVQGVAPKAWIRENGEFYLLKDGDKRDVDAEVLASEIIDCFNIDYVKYEYSTYCGEKVSKCRIITSEEKSIVSYEFIDVYCENKGIDKFDFILKKDAYSYYMMNIIDYIIGNTDRHWGNWGFYVDNSNNKLQGLYPLMDFNKAFSAYDTVEGAVSQTTKQRMSQKDAAIEAVRKIGVNLKKEVSPELFEDEAAREMFFERLRIIQKAELRSDDE